MADGRPAVSDGVERPHRPPTGHRHHGPRLYAPYGLDDLLGLVVRPDPASPAPREVHETKAARWQAVWPELVVLPWGP